MRLKLPKPLHGWRQFAGEVGIIVLGVLIALAAQQFVQNIQDRQLAQQAQKDIRAELAYDSAFAVERIAIGDCMRASFTDLRQRLVASSDSWPGLDARPISGAPRSPAENSLFASPPPLSSPHRLWPVSAWAAATTSGVFTRGQSHFFNYAALYAMVNALARLQDHEIADYSELMPLEVPQKLDPATRLQLLRNVGALDADNAGVERLAAVFVTAAEKRNSARSRVAAARLAPGRAVARDLRAAGTGPRRSPRPRVQWRLAQLGQRAWTDPASRRGGFAG